MLDFQELIFGVGVVYLMLISKIGLQPLVAIMWKA